MAEMNSCRETTVGDPIPEGSDKLGNLGSLIEEEVKVNGEQALHGSVVVGVDGLNSGEMASVTSSSTKSVETGCANRSGVSPSETVSLDANGVKSGEILGVDNNGTRNAQIVGVIGDGMKSVENESDSSFESESASSSSSASASSSSSDDEDSQEEEEEEEEGGVRDSDGEEMVAWSDGEDDGGGFGDAVSGPIRSKNELKVLPPISPVTVTLQPYHQTVPVGAVLSIIGSQVIVEGVEKHDPLNEGSILWITESRSPLGLVEEIFGPVKNPYYLVRYNSDNEIPAGIQQGTSISFVQDFANHVLNDNNLHKKGYDASGEYDEEVPDEAEFSDDEEEAEYRKKLKMTERGTNDKKQGNRKEGKKFKNRGGSWKSGQPSVPKVAVDLCELPTGQNQQFIPPIAASLDHGSRRSFGQGQGFADGPGIFQPFPQLSQATDFNEGSILWITESRSPLGLVEEIFGPVKNPYYLVRYNSDNEIPAGIQQGTSISFVQDFANHVLNDNNLHKKGYDASGEYDEEVPDEAEFSDDEEEAEYRKKLKMTERGTNDKKQGNRKEGKKFKNRGGSWKSGQPSVPKVAVDLCELPTGQNQQFIPPIAASLDHGSRRSFGQGQGFADGPGIFQPFPQLSQATDFNEGSILWITESRSPLGLVEEIFGPVKNPYYLVRYNSDNEIPAGIQQGTSISFVQDFANHVLNDNNLHKKGYDASGEYDEEVPDEAEFSDDEEEAEYRKKLKMTERGTNDKKQGNRKEGKKFKNRGGSWKSGQPSVPKVAVDLCELPTGQNQQFIPPIAASLDHGSRRSFGQGQGFADGPGIFQPFPQLSQATDFLAPSNGVRTNGMPCQQQQQGMVFLNGIPTNGMRWLQENHHQPLNRMPLLNGMPSQQQLNPGQRVPYNSILPGEQSNFCTGHPSAPWPGCLVQNDFNQISSGMGFQGQSACQPINEGAQGIMSSGLWKEHNCNLQPPSVFLGNIEASQNLNQGVHFARGRKPYHRGGGGRFSGGRG